MDETNTEPATFARPVLLACVVVALVLLQVLALPSDHVRGTDTTPTMVVAWHIVWFVTVGVALACMDLLDSWSVPRAGLVVLVLAAAVLVTNYLEIAIVSDLCKIGFAGVAGRLFVRAVERPWWMIAVGLSVPVADAWSVFSDRGVTNAVVDKGMSDPRWLTWPTVASPVPYAPYEEFMRIGIVDVLFFALFVAAAQRWHLGVWRVVPAGALSFVAGTVMLLVKPSAAIPALPLLCLAFLVVTAPGLWADIRAARSDSG